MKTLLKLATLFALSAGWLSAQTLYLYPTAPVAPRGSYQTVTAIVNGVNNKTVTWSTDCGTIVGTNPGTANEPNVIALYDATAQTCHLTATSNANGTVTATSTVTFTASPTPRTDHPRFLMTSSQLPTEQAKGVGTNPMYSGISTLASNYYTPDSSIWTFSTWNGSACTGGSGPSSDQSAQFRENDAWWMSLVSMISASSSTRNQYGCAARDVFMTNIGYVISGAIDLSAGNRWSDGSEYWAFTADNLMAGGYLSSADKAIVRTYLSTLAFEQINNHTNGDQAVIGSYNSSAQFEGSNTISASGMRAMMNNYTQSRVLLLMAIAFTFNDDTTDDPPLSNTCSATRYQVCPDGTAGSLHAYWTYDWGGMLYKDWANMEDATVTRPAYNTAFANLPSTPMCNTLWGTSMSCLGQSRGGESSEGVYYGYSLARLRWLFNGLHNAGLDDPLSQRKEDGSTGPAPQISLGTSSYWDLRYVADISQLTGLSGFAFSPSTNINTGQRWTMITNGDSFNYYFYPSNLLYNTAMLASDYATGRTDRSNALEWVTLNSSFGMADGTQGGCIFTCGYVAGLTAAQGAADTAMDAFIALPATNPVTTSPPTDPRPSLPTDWFNAGNQHIIARDGTWGTGTGTVFSLYCPNTMIDHEEQYCGGFSLYSNGEHITKGRMEFNDYHDADSAAQDQNSVGIINTPTSTQCNTTDCKFYGAAQFGGQWYHAEQGGLVNLLHSELPNYVAAIVDDTNLYNAGSAGDYPSYNGVTGASRSLIYLRNAKRVIRYDRAATGSQAWGKASYQVSTGNPTITGNQAVWTTRSGNQKAAWTSLLPASTNPTLDVTYTGTDATNDWEIYGRLKVNGGSVTSQQFLSDLEWGTVPYTPTTPTLVQSTAGQNFDCDFTAGETTMVCFMRSWPATFTSTTYPASGATTHYVSDLSPNTTYTITASGAPTTGTTDNAGVLAFASDGTGSVSILAGGTPTAATPTFSPVAGTYTGSQSVTISTTSSGAIECYNFTGAPATNGVTSCAVGSTLYSAPVTVSSTSTLYAVAGGTGYLDSAVGSAAYVINLPAAATPTCTPPGSTYSTAQTVTCSSTTPSSTTYCTIDGSTPTTSSPVCTGISVASTLTLKAISAASGFTNSAILTQNYTITAATPQTTITGTVTVTGTVTIQ